MARVTGLEPATSGVTGRHSNRLSYTRAFDLAAHRAKRLSNRAGLPGQAVLSGALQRSVKGRNPAPFASPAIQATQCLLMC